MGGPCTVDGESKQELDNWFICRFQLDGKEWPSAEHYYQAAKYPGDEEHQEAIRAAPNGTRCWSLGQDERPSLRKDLQEKKVELMYQANRAKFSQNPALRSLLVRTSGPIEAQGDPFWKTWNEVLLERLREELRDYENMDARAQALRLDMMKGYQQAAKDGDHAAMEAATTWAAKRQLPPPRDIIVKGGSDASRHPWLCGTYRVDTGEPASNGMPHYVNDQGGHLFLHTQDIESVWLLENTLASTDAAPTLTIRAGAGGKLPLGAQIWKCSTVDAVNVDIKLFMKAA